MILILITCLLLPLQCPQQIRAWSSTPWGRHPVVIEAHHVHTTCWFRINYTKADKCSWNISWETTLLTELTCFLPIAYCRLTDKAREQASTAVWLVKISPVCEWCMKIPKAQWSVHKYRNSVTDLILRQKVRVVRQNQNEVLEWI